MITNGVLGQLEVVHLAGPVIGSVPWKQTVLSSLPGFRHPLSSVSDEYLIRAVDVLQGFRRLR